jgi:hypothetical protein
MFNPSQQEVRRFFCGVRSKQREGAPLTPLEDQAGRWIAEHPEYHRWLDDPQTSIDRAFDGADGTGNPFLHLSMHLAITEQLSIDQPPGIRMCFQALIGRLGSEHAAAHDAMECLGEILWRAERSGQAPDGAAYLDCLSRRAR